MHSQTITVHTMLDGKHFTDFANFDIFKLRKRHIKPILFCLILTAFSILCFILNNGKNQGSLLGTVLLIIAIGLPAVYFGLYFRSLGYQVKQMRLSKPRLVYTLELSDPDDGIHTIERPDPRFASGTDTEHTYKWSEAYGAFRRKDVIYLYVSDKQAYIIPDGQADSAPEFVWSFISSHIDSSKVHG